jgi:hypothetical protein
MSCSLWCGSGQYADQDVHTLIKIPAFAGMTEGGRNGERGGAGMTAGAELTEKSVNDGGRGANGEKRE